MQQQGSLAPGRRIFFMARPARMKFYTVDKRVGSVKMNGVQNGGRVCMNTVVTSRQALLAASRTVARRQGLGGLSIRAVAAEARVSVGSVYNYFSGKTELLAATVEEIWMQILSAPEGEAPRDGFAAYVHWLFHRIQSGAGEYPGFFQGHAAGFLPEGRSAGRRTMAEALGRVRQTLLEALEADCAVRPSAFDASFSRGAACRFRAGQPAGADEPGRGQL